METGLVSWHVSIRIADHNRSDDDKKKKNMIVTRVIKTTIAVTKEQLRY